MVEVFVIICGAFMDTLLGSLPVKDGGPGGNTGTAKDKFGLGELGKKKGSGAEVGAGTGDVSEARTGEGTKAVSGARLEARSGTGVEAEVRARSVGSLGKEGSKGQ